MEIEAVVENRAELSIQHQFARMILAATASFIVGKLVENTYTSYVTNSRQKIVEV